MSNINLRIAVAALSIGLSMQAWAEEEQDGPWSGKIGAGYVSTSGNNETTSFTGKAEVNWEGERWHHGVLGRALGQSVDKDTTAEAYKVAYKGKFDLAKRTYLFGSLDYNKDRFSSYNKQFFQVLGIGQRFIKTDRHELNGELSAGASQSTLIETLPPGTVDVNEAVFRISGDYLWAISENSSFSQKLSVSSGSSNTYTESVTELSAGIIGALSTVLGYTIRHNSDVADGKDKKDTFASISLEYVF